MPRIHWQDNIVHLMIMWQMGSCDPIFHQDFTTITSPRKIKIYSIVFLLNMYHFHTIVKKRVIKYLSTPNWQTVKIPVGK